MVVVNGDAPSIVLGARCSLVEGLRRYGSLVLGTAQVLARLKLLKEVRTYLDIEMCGFVVDYLYFRLDFLDFFPDSRWSLGYIDTVLAMQSPHKISHQCTEFLVGGLQVGHDRYLFRGTFCCEEVKDFDYRLW
jgi:hypothetical protein